MTIRYYETIPPYERALWQGDHVEPPSEGCARWGGKHEVPAVGAQVRCIINRIGVCTVLRYFTEEGWLGFLAAPKDPPAWYVKQNGATKPCHIFGPEFVPMTAIEVGLSKERAS